MVNVASVPHRSPFRYAGGKTWLIPYVRAWLGALPEPPAVLVEPFAGGGGVGLAAIFEDLAERALLIELDEDVSAVWRATLLDGARLAERIRAMERTPAALRAAAEASPDGSLEHALGTIVRNRLNRGGILAPGAGRLKLGENGNGLLSRWYPETLARRIEAIHARRGRVATVCADGLSYLARYAAYERAAFFIDPPYVTAGRRLYRHSAIDHERLFALVAELRGDFLLTYDAHDEIRALAERHRFAVAEVAMKSTHHSRKTELLIARRLDWLAEVQLSGHAAPAAR